MREPVEPAAKTGVAAEPVFAVEEETEREAGKEPEKNSGPGQHEIDLRRIHEPSGGTLSVLAGKVLIDKTGETIESVDV